MRALSLCDKANQQVRNELYQTETWLHDFKWSSYHSGSHSFRIWFPNNTGVSFTNSPLTNAACYIETALVRGNEDNFELMYDEELGYEDVILFYSKEELVEHLRSLVSEINNQSTLP